MRQRQEPAYTALLALILVGGVAVRLAVAAIHPTTFDLDNFARSAALLRRSGLDFYGTANAGPVASFPYPPAYLTWLLAVDALGGSFTFLVRLGPTAADTALAWLVQRHLRREAPPGVALGAAALIAFGPTVILTAAADAQFDSVAILPGVLAVLVWRSGRPRRALLAGLLIGAGTALKTTPLVLLAALVPTVRSRGEGLRLVVIALAVPVVLLAPFLAADAAGVVDSLRYHGYPGGGGLNVVVQPNLADYSGRPLTNASRVLQDVNSVLVAITVAALTWLLWRRRVEPVRAAAILWLGIFVAGVNWYPQYLNWGLPFFLMTGWVVWVAVVQVVLLPFALTYVSGALGGGYFPLRHASLVASSVVAWLLWLLRLTRETVGLTRRDSSRRA